MFGVKKNKMQEWKEVEAPKEPIKELPSPVSEMKQDSSINETPTVSKMEQAPEKKEVGVENQTIDMFSLLQKMHTEYAKLALKWDGIIGGIASLNEDETEK